MLTRKDALLSVKVAFPAGRHAQLRYKDADGNVKKISAESSDPIEVERQRVLLEARLLAGDFPRERKTRPVEREGDEDLPHLDMPRDEYRVFYYRRYLPMLRRKARSSARSSPAIAGRLLKFHFETDLDVKTPVNLGHMLKRVHLNKIRELLEQGKYSKRKTRSKFTVVSVMKAVIASLNWAAEEEYIEAVPKIRLPKLSKLKASKGRPIDEIEFQAMLDATPAVVGMKEAASWQFVLRGLWESGFRIGELIQFGWDIPSAITPVWRRGKLPVRHFPAEQQKNDTEEEIPLLPGLERLLISVPMDDRSGWIFNPMPVKGGRRHVERVSEEWAARSRTAGPPGWPPSPPVTWRSSSCQSDNGPPASFVSRSPSVRKTQ